MLRPLLVIAAVLAVPAFAFDNTDAAPAAPDLDAARSLIDAGDFAGAVPVLESLAGSAPSDADVANLLGYALRNLGRLDEAGLWYARALETDPGHLGALEYQGEMFLMLGERARAEANLDRLTELCGSCEEREELAAALAAGS
jgi:Flp pilus assembly protein TadD